MADGAEHKGPNGNWSMSDERAFMENLLCSRFNFFLVFFSLILAGGVATEDPAHFRILFWIGFAVSLLLALTISRAQAKLDRALRDHLFATDGHPAQVLNEGQGWWSMRKLIGYVIPWLCVLILLAGALFGDPASSPAPIVSAPSSGQAQGAPTEQTSLPDLLQGIAALLWPLLFAGLLWYFRREIRLLLARIKRGKILGQEFDFGEALDALNKDARDAEDSTAAEADLAQHEDAASTARDDRQREITDRVLEESARNPKVGLMILSSELEREVRHLVTSMGMTEQRGPVMLRPALDDLISKRLVSDKLRGAIQRFAEIRNAIVHGHDADEDDALRAVDSGLSILRAVWAVPHEKHVVLYPSVEVFADRDCSIPRQDIRAVVLESFSPAGTSSTKRAFPTSRPDYKVGQRVGWQWDRKQVIDESWYRDPEGEVQYGWRSSLLFVGEPVE